MANATKQRAYTPNQIVASFDDNDLAYHRLMRSDPVVFAKVACGFHPHSKQIELLRSPLEKQKTLLAWGRQFGKTSILSVYLAWKLFAESNYSGFLFAPSGEQSRILFDKICHYYMTSEYLQRFSDYKIKGSVLSVGGASWNSRVEYIKTGLTAETARGRSTSGHGIICFDEINSWLYPETVTGVIEPFISSGGGEVFLSSPGEVGSFMHELYLDLKEQQALGSQRHRVIECQWDDTDHLLPDFVNEQKRVLTKQGREWFFRREYLGEWTKTEGAFFNRDDVLACQSKTALDQGGKKSVWIYSLDPGLDRSPAVLLISRWNPVDRRLEIVECLSLIRQSNRYVDKDGGQTTIEGYPDLLDLILELRRERPIHRLYIDPGCEKNIGETLRNRFAVNVVDCRIGGYNAKLTALRDLERTLATKTILWEDHRIADELLQFTPPLNPLTNKYEFPDKKYDIIAALTQLCRYLGDRVEEPFVVRTARRKIW